MFYVPYMRKLKNLYEREFFERMEVGTDVSVDGADYYINSNRGLCVIIRWSIFLRAMS